MAIRAMIKRVIPKGKEKEAITIITGLRMLASRYPGYISGETLTAMPNIKHLKSLHILFLRRLESFKILNRYKAGAR